MNRATLKHVLRFAALTIISSLVSYCALAGSTVTASREYVNRKFDAATNYVDSATNDVLVAAQGYTDEKISEISAPDFSTNNVELVETIETMAPPPGDYAAVSNAAVHAAITNALQDAALEGKLDKSGGTVNGTLAVKVPDDFGVPVFEINPGDSQQPVHPVMKFGDTGGVVHLHWRIEQTSDGHYNVVMEAANELGESRQINLPFAAGTLALAAPSPTAGNLAALDNDGNPVDSGIAKSDLDPLLFAQYYPEGNVKSAAEFTRGIKYDAPDTTNRTITVKSFSNTVYSENNSGLVGRVVIPPFVDGDSNPYISDDGTRYRVVGVSDAFATMVSGSNTNLTAIVAPSTVTTIGSYAFYICTSLTSVSLPAATSIGRGAFAYCSALTSVSLPAATSIVDWAFGYCDSLTSVSLPAATTIGISAFKSCTSLTSVDFGDASRPAVPDVSPYAFDAVPTTCKIIVPDAQYDAWTAPTLPDGETENPWHSLVEQGYRFLKHSEWEYVRKYELVRRYPMFVIDLNPDDQRIWNHFELKASTNNFTNATSANMLFFTASTVNGVTNAEFDVGYPYDWCRLYILSGRAGGGAADPRSWTRIRNTAELDTYAPLAVAVIVDMEMLKRGQGSEWLYEDNEEIVWSYLRIGLDSAERDQTGARCWRPVSPVRWYRKLPQWAEQECTSFSTSGIRPYETPLDGDR